MHTKEENLSLSNLKNGEAVAKFDRILQNDILPNIQDPNTNPTAPREITLKVQFKPEKERFTAGISIEVYASKLAKDEKSECKAIIDTGLNGEIVIKELLPAQQELFPEEKELPANAISFKKAHEGRE